MAPCNPSASLRTSGYPPQDATWGKEEPRRKIKNKENTKAAGEGMGGDRKKVEEKRERGREGKEDRGRDQDRRERVKQTRER